MMSANRTHSAAATDSLIGQTIGGQYTLQRFLGHGSKARVFLATHRTLHRSVVVHLLAVPWADDSAAVTRFEEQARALRGLEHPNIAAIIDYGREPGRVFVVGEYVEGKLLDSYIDQLGRLTLEGFVPIAAQILKGLGATHARGLVHRDLKPTNVVLVEEQGRANYVKILDLGLAQILEGPARGDDVPPVGTPDYLAPEQIMNKPLDPRTDVYALGVVFYRMLSGRLPFEADHGGARSVLYKHVNDKPIPLTEALGPGHNLPEGLIDLVHDCLAKNPDNRPADANEIVERLIDSVPAAMFRLPIASAAASPPRHLTTDLPRSQTGDFGRIPALRPEPVPQHERALAAAVEASGLRPVGAVHIVGMVDSGDTQTRGRRQGGGSAGWVLGLLALALTGGLVYLYIQSQNETLAVAPDTKTAPDPAVVAGDAALDAALTRARELEAAGKTAEALVAYEAILAGEPEHPVARERVAALRAMTAPVPPQTDPTPPVADPTAGTPTPTLDPTAGTPPPDPAAGTGAAVPPPDPAAGTGAAVPPPDPTAGDTAGSKPEPATDPKPAEPVHVQFLVEVSPRGEVLVDGISRGKAPLKLDLPAGPHKFEIRSLGFLNHEETIEVAADGQKSLKVKMVRPPRGSSGINRAEEDAASNELDPENDAPTTKIEVPLKR